LLSVELDQDITDLVNKFSEHYHDAWASRKQENGWSFGDTRNDETKHHPRLKPYGILSEYVSGKMWFDLQTSDMINVWFTTDWNS